MKKMLRLKMLRSRLFRWVAVAVVIAVGVTIAAVAGSVGPFSNRPNISPPPPPGRPATPLSQVDPATAADEAKGLYKGPLGDFVVNPREQAAFPPCPLPMKRTQNYKTSELYSPVFGENLEVYECANGKIVNIAFIGGPAMGRGYFTGPAKIPWEGPFDRLVLLTVGGHSAIAQLPHPAFPGSLRLAVIERFPSGNEPGILVWIDDAGSSLERAAALAARIMGVQP